MLLLRYYGVDSDVILSVDAASGIRTNKYIVDVKKEFQQIANCLKPLSPYKAHYQFTMNVVSSGQLLNVIIVGERKHIDL